ncbi:BLUF domain-containing protein [Tritonibacter scottomollicae]|uniref:BLUF domain-containing protein n=1 Tax=Tritonibacter scottomollicae TaxID=483013 RepID=UPI003AA98159
MSSPLIASLIYVSTARSGLGLDDFLKIMAVSQRNNQRFGITGLLAFNGLNFMQCLEGDRAATNECLHRIELDDRHSGVTVVNQREATRRQFSDWHMAGQYLPAGQGLGQTDLQQALSDDAVCVATRTIFRSFFTLGGNLPR